MRTRYLPFIDWLKCIGIVLIVWGHVAARPINQLTPPIYPKQLGVAFFLFVLGFSLANERRPRVQVLFNRLFELYLYAVPLALLISVLFPIRHTLNLSNYLPFLFGANVLVNNFPANPTTWFVGTYLHILVVWALFMRFPVRGWMVAVSFVLEIAIRAALTTHAGGYIAYMSLFNWSTVFLFGLWWGRRETAMRSVQIEHSHRGALGWLAVLAALVAGWARWLPGYVLTWSFPFADLAAGSAAPLVASACVSGLYLGHTFLLFQVGRRLSAPGVVRVVARNTLFVFLVHMPVFKLLYTTVGRQDLPYVWFALINMLVCFVGLTVLSETINRVIAPRRLREQFAARLFPRSPAVVTPALGARA